MPRGGRLSDEALRTLERAAAADPARTLEWARALERAGRGDEALLALCRAIDRADVRTELATRPSWSHVGGPGGCRSLDVPPVRRAPRVRWSVSVGGDHLLASPLGVVVLEGAAARPLAVLDPRTGARRWRPDHFTQDAWLDGGLLLARSVGELFVWRLWAEDGEELPNAAHVRLGQTPEAFELQREADEVRLVASQVPALPAGAPGDGYTPQVMGGAGVAIARMSGARAIVDDGSARLLVGHSSEPSPHVWGRALDLLASPRWTVPGTFVAADAQGALVLEQKTVRLVDLAGQERWSSPSPEVTALGPRHVVLGPVSGRPRRSSGRGASSVVRVLDRATGMRVADLARHGRPGCLVRDVLVLPGRDTSLAAWTAEGALLWRHGPYASWVVDLAPLPGALVVLLGNPGQVLCLEEDA